MSDSYNNLLKSPLRDYSLFRSEKDDVLVSTNVMKTGFNWKTFYVDSIDADVSLFSYLLQNEPTPIGS